MLSGNTEPERKAPSPLAFARAWQEYQATAAQTPLPDSRVLLAARFWATHAQSLHTPASRTYVQEDLPPLFRLIDKALPGDLLPDELEEIAVFLTAAASDQGEAVRRTRRIWEDAARGWFYVGEVERALRALVRAGLLTDTELSGLTGVSKDSDHPDAEALRIGAVNGIPVKGIIDDVALFSVALEEEDIQEIMNNGLQKTLNIIAVESAGKLAVTWGRLKAR